MLREINGFLMAGLHVTRKDIATLAVLWFNRLILKALPAVLLLVDVVSHGFLIVRDITVKDFGRLVRFLGELWDPVIYMKMFMIISAVFSKP